MGAAAFHCGLPFKVATRLNNNTPKQHRSGIVPRTVVFTVEVPPLLFKTHRAFVAASLPTAGSVADYYFAEATDPARSRLWLVWLQGGAWCNDEKVPPTAAAIPVENPYCSCKLTQQVMAYSCNPLWRIPAAAVG